MSVAYCTFDGVDPGANGAILEHRHLYWLPEMHNRATPVDSRPGSHDFGTMYGERRIDLDFWVSATTRAALETQLGNLAKLFDPTNEVAGDRGFKRLVFDSLSDRYYLAKLGSSPMVAISSQTATMTLQMRCADPMAQAVSQTSTTLSGANVTYTDAGTTRNQPAIEVTLGATYTGNIVVTNATTGESLTWTGSVVNGDVLKIDSALYRVYKNNTLAMTGLVNGSKFPSSIPGSNNITATGGSPTQIKITYRSRYL